MDAYPENDIDFAKNLVRDPSNVLIRNDIDLRTNFDVVFPFMHEIRHATTLPKDRIFSSVCLFITAHVKTGKYLTALAAIIDFGSVSETKFIEPTYTVTVLFNFSLTLRGSRLICLTRFLRSC